MNTMNTLIVCITVIIVSVMLSVTLIYVANENKVIESNNTSIQSSAIVNKTVPSDVSVKSSSTTKKVPVFKHRPTGELGGYCEKCGGYLGEGKAGEICSGYGWYPDETHYYTDPDTGEKLNYP